MSIRAWVLLSNPLCVECQQTGKVVPATEVDHIVPLHKGGTDDASNLQGLCAEHHANKTQRERGHTPRRRIGVDGWPTG